jgi:hypothetical protein
MTRQALMVSSIALATHSCHPVEIAKRSEEVVHYMKEHIQSGTAIVALSS